MRFCGFISNDAKHAYKTAIRTKIASITVKEPEAFEVRKAPEPGFGD